MEWLLEEVSSRSHLDWPSPCSHSHESAANRSWFGEIGILSHLLFRGCSSAKHFSWNALGGSGSRLHHGDLGTLARSTTDHCPYWCVKIAKRNYSIFLCNKQEILEFTLNWFNTWFLEKMESKTKVSSSRYWDFLNKNISTFPPLVS